MLLAPFDDIVNAPAGRLADAGGRHFVSSLLRIAEVFLALEASCYIFVLYLHYKSEVRRKLIDIECTAELAQKEEREEYTLFALECIRYTATRSLNDAKNILIADCKNGGGYA